MSGLAKSILSNPIFVFVVVGFAVVIIMGIDAMASFEDAIYTAMVSAFEFLPIIAIIGALGYVTGRRS